MLQIKDFGDVTQLRMGTSYFNRTFYQVCAYLVDGLMVDTGCYGCRDELAAICTQFPVDQAILTHYHEDHSGNGWYFNQQGIPIWAHQKTANYLNRAATSLPLYRRFIWQSPPTFSVQIVGDSLSTDLHSFQIMHTPGHTADHICIYEAQEGWLFSGDNFLGEQVKIAGWEEDFHQLIASLKIIQELDLSTIFCSLGRIVTNPKKALAKKIRFMEETREQVYQLYTRGLNERQITQRLLGSDWFLKFSSGGDFCKENLVRSVLSTNEKGW